MIVDSSTLIDWLAVRNTGATTLLSSAMQRQEHASILPCILQEALQGARNLVMFGALADQLQVFCVLLVAHPESTARMAADIYARCRWSGFTPRSPIDCLIAASCIELDEPLLHNDRDFNQIAQIDRRLKLVAA